MDVGDCQPVRFHQYVQQACSPSVQPIITLFVFIQEYCLDLFEPSGHGRRRRREVNAADSRTKEISSKGNTTQQSAKFHENIEYTVLMPGGKFSSYFNQYEGVKQLVPITLTLFPTLKQNYSLYVKYTIRRAYSYTLPINFILAISHSVTYMKIWNTSYSNYIYINKIIINASFFYLLLDIYHQELTTEHSCHTFIVTSGVLGCLLLLSALVMCYLAIRLQTTLTSKYRQTNMDTIARERSHKLSLGHLGIPGYTGRATLQ